MRSQHFGSDRSNSGHGGHRRSIFSGSRSAGLRKVLCLHIEREWNRYSTQSKTTYFPHPTRRLATGTSFLGTAIKASFKRTRSTLHPDQVGFAVNPRHRAQSTAGKGLRGHHRLSARIPLRRIRHAARAARSWCGRSKRAYSKDAPQFSKLRSLCRH
jgi:hypothetical protein